MAIEQISVGDNFSYIIYCPDTNQAALVDPGFEPETALELIKKKHLKLKYIINTHHHSDHTAGNLKAQHHCSCDIIASSIDKTHLAKGVSKHVYDGEILYVGKIKLQFIHTPGHTLDGLCIIVDDKALITGDTLFINDCGRCDLAGGSLTHMFNTLQDKIKRLPDELIVYPGHDYGPKPFDTLGNQKKENRTLTVKSYEEFTKLD